MNFKKAADLTETLWYRAGLYVVNAPEDQVETAFDSLYDAICQDGVRGGIRRAQELVELAKV